MPQVICSYCKKLFNRDNRRLNESKKFGWKGYCSLKCQYLSKNHQIECTCLKPGCGRIFERTRNEFVKSSLHYCSRSCAAIVNNSKYIKNPGTLKQCTFCGNDFKSREKFCSKACKDKAATISPETIIDMIKNFYEVNGRTPTKWEFPHYRAIRSRFVTWNNAIKSAGFDPNPVMFAKKYTANDGHICDSLSEKIIDDWLYARKIKHETNFPYPESNGFTVDFKVKDFWIEFFGLTGQLKSYDELKKKKLKIVKQHKLKLIKIYPKDIFPVSKLDKKLVKLSHN